MAENEKNVNTELEEDEREYITLEFDDGEEIECEIMGIFGCKGKDYIALIPDDGSDDVYIYGYREIDSENFELVDIEDDDEFNAAVEEFNQIVAEEA